jgi:DNA-directed RNA polymerase specialized sigma24 family protein
MPEQDSEALRAGHRRKIKTRSMALRTARQSYLAAKDARNEALAAAHGPRKMGGLSYAEIADLTDDEETMAKVSKSRVMQIIRKVRDA